jgi:hypothetical protein
MAAVMAGLKLGPPPFFGLWKPCKMDGEPKPGRSFTAVCS